MRPDPLSDPLSDHHPDPHPDLVFDRLDVHSTDAGELARLRAYADAWSLGFHEGGLDDDKHRRWLESTRTDDAVLRAVWPRTSRVAGTPAPVGTFTSWQQQVNVGGGRLLPLHMITDVTVAPTHRRRGLLRRLMGEDLAEAADRGLPLAALTVSEGSIYGRYGFGVATRRRRIEVDLTTRFALRDQVEDTGALELATPAEAYPVCREVFARVLATTRGMVARPAHHAVHDSGEHDWETGGPDRASRVAVHLDPSGTPDGYVRFRVKDTDGGLVEVRDLQALGPQVHLRLWRFLADLDLTAKARAIAPVEDPLDLALTDPRVVTTTEVRDVLWLRVLDPVAALEARPWSADATVVLGVDDPLGHAAGTFRVTTEQGRARVEATDEAPGVRLGVDTLGALYLGDRSVLTAAAAGRVTGSDVATWAAMADHAGPAPWNTTGF